MGERAHFTRGIKEKRGTGCHGETEVKADKNGRKKRERGNVKSG